MASMMPTAAGGRQSSSYHRAFVHAPILPIQRHSGGGGHTKPTSTTTIIRMRTRVVSFLFVLFSMAFTITTLLGVLRLPPHHSSSGGGGNDSSTTTRSTGRWNHEVASTKKTTAATTSTTTRIDAATSQQHKPLLKMTTHRDDGFGYHSSSYALMSDEDERSVLHEMLPYASKEALEWRMIIGEQHARATHAPGTAPALEEVLSRLQQHHFVVGEGEERNKLSTSASTTPSAAQRSMESGDSNDTSLRVALANALYRRGVRREPVRVVFCLTLGGSRASVERDVLPWILYHTELGVWNFFILYDGKDADALRLLRSLHNVFVRALHKDVAEDIADEPKMRERYTSWAERHWQWGHRPGNYALMVKQTFNQNEAILWAKVGHADWIMHIDPDEFVLPLYQGDGSGDDLSFARYLHKQPSHVSSLRIFNAEAQPEHAYVKNRLEEVTLFKMNKALMHFDAYAMRTKVRLGGNRAYMILYANGKSVARANATNLRSLGPHFWKGDGSPNAPWTDTLADDATILHYAYTRVEDVASKAGTSCPGDEYREAALRGNRTKLKECFVIDFDLDAFRVASTGDSVAIRKFFEESMVLQEGARVRCRRSETDATMGWCEIRDVRSLIADAMRIGLLRREHAVQAISRSHARLVRAVEHLSKLQGASGMNVDALFDAALLD